MNLIRVDHKKVGEIANTLPDRFEEKIQEREQGVYSVQSFSGEDKTYEVQVVKRPFGWLAACTCDGWKHTKNTLVGKDPCKHIAAVLLLQPGFDPDEKFSTAPQQPKRLAPKGKVQTGTVQRPTAPAKQTKTMMETIGTSLVHPVASISAVKEVFEAFEQAKRDLLTPKDVITADGKAYIKKSGWRKIGVFFGLSLQKISEGWVSDANKVWQVTYRAIAPGGQYQDATAYCSWNEAMPLGRLRNAEEYARKMVAAQRWTPERAKDHIDGVIAKLEHDIRVTAETRAKNRAISDLVGGGEISAEEVEDVSA